MGRAAWVALLVIGACADEQPAVRTGSACPAQAIREIDDHWMATHPFLGDNDWRRATYFIGHMVVAKTLDDPAYADYLDRWAESHAYQVRDGAFTRNADNHTAGQVYLALYERDHIPDQLAYIKISIDHVVDSGDRGDWSWVDAQFMASPVYAHLGELTGDPRYHAAMFELFADARDRRHLYDASTGLWFRDENYLYPAAHTSHGRKIYWARGNGWVIASVVRTLEHLAADSPYRAAYEDMLRAMAAGLVSVQRDDGLWNVNLADADDYPGPESSGTAFFVYGIAWGVNHGVLDRATYAPVVERGWRGLVTLAMRADGELGLVQGVGEEPASSQPVTLASTHDYGVGAFLLAGSEVAALGLDLGCGAR
ncbi:MAG TPA: glycoside hydrolase family 88 protein [Kofleriaceae bacterium]|nr:glycoside hydrolase family 88 protein [Kofleriaceae bacterium]